MNYFDRLSEIPYLKYAFYSYLFLGITDTIHHFHAASVLGQNAAMHAAVIGIAVPGFYHGGWSHLVKVLAHLRINSPSTEIVDLFPAQNMDLWFYEVTGLLEFMFALFCSYFVYMLIKNRAEIKKKQM